MCQFITDSFAFIIKSMIRIMIRIIIESKEISYCIMGIALIKIMGLFRSIYPLNGESKLAF